MGVKEFFERDAGTVIIILLVIMGLALMMSLNVGGIVFGLGCWVVAYVVWLLQRAVSALEDVMNIQVQSICQARQQLPEREEPHLPATGD